MAEMILVSGHKSPDTDTICSALVCTHWLRAQGKEAKAIRAGEINKETAFALDYFGSEAPELLTRVEAGQPMYLVDHNESKQAVDGMTDADVQGLIDHHRLGDFTTDQPILIRIEPVGCTGTILYSLYQQCGIEIPRQMAGLMLSAIISDTLLFRSPTCTERDRKAVQELAQIADVDYEKYGMDMLKAGADLSDKTAAELVLTDKKEFDGKKGTFSIAQLSVMDTQPILAQRDELLRLLEEDRAAHNYEASFLMVTDILEESTDLLYTSQVETASEAAFQVKGNAQTLHLPGVMSRKKQVAPPLLGAL